MDTSYLNPFMSTVSLRERFAKPAGARINRSSYSHCLFLTGSRAGRRHVLKCNQAEPTRLQHQLSLTNLGSGQCSPTELQPHNFLSAAKQGLHAFFPLYLFLGLLHVALCVVLKCIIALYTVRSYKSSPWPPLRLLLTLHYASY